MEEVKIVINLQGTFCNNWPCGQVDINGNTVFNGQIKDEQLIEFCLSCQDHGSIVITHYDKQNGDNGIWDTKIDEDGNILEDRAIIIKDIVINDVSIVEYIQQWPLIDDAGKSHTTTYIGFNGTMTIPFRCPVYDWIIDNLLAHKIYESQRDKVIDNSSGLNMFSYAEDIKELREFQDLISKYAHLFAKPT